ncbi:hypothetical protein ONA91_18280 [Micromonospora sp. DR5-3]|nr:MULTISPECIES: hypothetical protein [unclassified Micromonospora]MCW3816396.1 hypothetical protein [Micromonospora sp. DR5-3]
MDRYGSSAVWKAPSGKLGGFAPTKNGARPSPNSDTYVGAWRANAAAVPRVDRTQTASVSAAPNASLGDAYLPLG